MSDGCLENDELLYLETMLNKSSKEMLRFDSNHK